MRRFKGLRLLLAGVLVGMVILLGRISNGLSYLSDRSETCINCHVMTDAYVSWQRGSHGLVAVCNDCHVPHDNAAAKWFFKGRDGLKHSYVFTLRKEPQVLRLSEEAQPVVQANCVYCHKNQLAMIRVGPGRERHCWDCHQNIHGPVGSLSSSPAALRPSLPKAGWLRPLEEKQDDR